MRVRHFRYPDPIVVEWPPNFRDPSGNRLEPTQVTFREFLEFTIALDRRWAQGGVRALSQYVDVKHEVRAADARAREAREPAYVTVAEDDWVLLRAICEAPQIDNAVSYVWAQLLPFFRAIVDAAEGPPPSPPLEQRPAAADGGGAGPS